MNLREDEIRAVLRFMSAELEVIENYDLLKAGGQRFIAIISHIDGTKVSYPSNNRIDAVTDAWDVFKSYMKTDDKGDPEWLNKTLLADLEVHLKRNQITENRDVKKLKRSKFNTAGVPRRSC